MTRATRMSRLAVSRVVELIVVVCVIGTALLAVHQLMTGGIVADGSNHPVRDVESLGANSAECRKQERNCVLQCDAGESRRESRCFELCIADSGCPVYL